MSARWAVPRPLLSAAFARRRLPIYACVRGVVMSQPSQHTTERRGFVRKKPKGARCRCRRGMMGLGPDLAVALIDLSLSGALLLLKAALEPKQAVVVELFVVAYPKPLSID